MWGDPINWDGPSKPADLIREAKRIALRCLSCPEEQKEGYLKELKGKHAVLHALVKAQLNEIRSVAVADPPPLSDNRGDWIRRLLGDMGVLPKPEDNLGWGI